MAEVILVSAQGQNPSFFFLGGDFLFELGACWDLGQGLGPGLEPGLDKNLIWELFFLLDVVLDRRVGKSMYLSSAVAHQKYELEHFTHLVACDVLHLASEGDVAAHPDGVVGHGLEEGRALAADPAALPERGVGWAAW